MASNSHLSPASFAAISDFFFTHSGIRLKDNKMSLVINRLSSRATALGSPSLNSYINTVLEDPKGPEAMAVIDSLTTNETYFFREPAHFEHLARVCRETSQSGREGFRVWSAASSSGEEAYSIAMTLAKYAGVKPWKVMGTDLSTKMVQLARQGLYTSERCSRVAREDLKRWCLRGEGQYAGQVLMSKELRAKVDFSVGNLLQVPSQIGKFDVVFLRNVLIYFEGPSKAQLVKSVIDRLHTGGYLYIGHAESIQDVDHGLHRVDSAIFQRV